MLGGLGKNFVVLSLVLFLVFLGLQSAMGFEYPLVSVFKKPLRGSCVFINIEFKQLLLVLSLNYVL